MTAADSIQPTDEDIEEAENLNQAVDLTQMSMSVQPDAQEFTQHDEMNDQTLVFDPMDTEGDKKQQSQTTDSEEPANDVAEEMRNLEMSDALDPCENTLVLEEAPESPTALSGKAAINKLTTPELLECLKISDSNEVNGVENIRPEKDDHRPTGEAASKGGTQRKESSQRKGKSRPTDQTTVKEPPPNRPTRGSSSEHRACDVDHKAWANEIVDCPQNNVMIQCDSCHVWFHLNCFGYASIKESEIPHVFNCYRCMNDKAVAEGKPLIFDLEAAVEIGRFRRAMCVAWVEGIVSVAAFAERLDIPEAEAQEYCRRMVEANVLLPRKNRKPKGKNKTVRQTNEFEVSKSYRSRTVFSTWMSGERDPLVQATTAVVESVSEQQEAEKAPPYRPEAKHSPAQLSTAQQRQEDHAIPTSTAEHGTLLGTIMPEKLEDSSSARGSVAPSRAELPRVLVAETPEPEERSSKKKRQLEQEPEVALAPSQQRFSSVYSSPEVLGAKSNLSSLEQRRMLSPAGMIVDRSPSLFTSELPKYRGRRGTTASSMTMSPGLRRTPCRPKQSAVNEVQNLDNIRSPLFGNSIQRLSMDEELENVPPQNTLRDAFVQKFEIANTQASGFAPLQNSIASGAKQSKNMASSQIAGPSGPAPPSKRLDEALSLLRKNHSDLRGMALLCEHMWAPLGGPDAAKALLENREKYEENLKDVKKFAVKGLSALLTQAHEAAAALQEEMDRHTKAVNMLVDLASDVSELLSVADSLALKNAQTQAPGPSRPPQKEDTVAVKHADRTPVIAAIPSLEAEMEARLKIGVVVDPNDIRPPAGRFYPDTATTAGTQAAQHGIIQRGGLRGSAFEAAVSEVLVEPPTVFNLPAPPLAPPPLLAIERANSTKRPSEAPSSVPAEPAANDDDQDASAGASTFKRQLLEAAKRRQASTGRSGSEDEVSVKPATRDDGPRRPAEARRTDSEPASRRTSFKDELAEAKKRLESKAKRESGGAKGDGGEAQGGPPPPPPLQNVRADADEKSHPPQKIPTSLSLQDQLKQRLAQRAEKSAEGAAAEPAKPAQTRKEPSASNHVKSLTDSSTPKHARSASPPVMDFQSQLRAKLKSREQTLSQSTGNLGDQTAASNLAKSPSLPSASSAGAGTNTSDAGSTFAPNLAKSPSLPASSLAGTGTGGIEPMSFRERQKRLDQSGVFGKSQPAPTNATPPEPARKTPDPKQSIEEKRKEIPIPPPPPAPVLAPILPTARAIAAYQASGPGQLTLAVGTVVTIHEWDFGPGWGYGEVDGVTGIFPQEYVKRD
ncbi:DNA binding protein [Phlyctochytrium bullatum]|nr:DNA binding protein [Phlyctochytrium bullatum]